MSERQKIMLVTGMSGAGKTTSLRVLEDLGWEAIDNFPIRLLRPLVMEVLAGEDRTPMAIGFDARTRGFAPATIIALVKSLSEQSDLELTTQFIDCNSTELERRYNETRRRHPLANGRTAMDGIRAERELLEPLRRWADMLIDTSQLTTNELQQFVRQNFETQTAADLAVTVSSFGFARGMPPLADLVFDMRFLDNPHWQPGLREQTGLDEPVASFMRQTDGFEENFERIRVLLLDLLPRYRAQGKSYVHIAFGCTGGRHRSVYTAQRMSQTLGDAGFATTVSHRNLASRAADTVEMQTA
ncbi:RNase adapter RapZ [Alteriqipengyuania sp. 357]